MNNDARRMGIPSTGPGWLRPAIAMILTWSGKTHEILARGFALFLGGFTLLNIAGDMLVPGFDANIWWIDLQILPTPLEAGLIGTIGAVLAAYGIRPQTGPFRRTLTLALTSIAAVAVLGNAAMFYKLLGSGALAGGVRSHSRSVSPQVWLWWPRRYALLNGITPLHVRCRLP